LLGHPLAHRLPQDIDTRFGVEERGSIHGDDGEKVTAAWDVDAVIVAHFFFSSVRVDALRLSTLHL
jgi:hypothetical protein